MTTVQLNLPDEVINSLGIDYEGLRGGHDIVVAIEGLDVTASLVTLAALRPKAHEFVRAIRQWRRRVEPKPATMIVKGQGIDLRVELPPNVQTADLLLLLQPLFGDAPLGTDAAAQRSPAS